MVHGWDDGDEPWNERKYFDMSLPENTRYSHWKQARLEYQSRTKEDTTRNDELFPIRTNEIKKMEKNKESITSVVEGYLPK